MDPQEFKQFSKRFVSGPVHLSGAPQRGILRGVLPSGSGYYTLCLRESVEGRGAACISQLSRSYDFGVSTLLVSQPVHVFRGNRSLILWGFGLAMRSWFRDMTDPVAEDLPIHNPPNPQGLQVGRGGERAQRGGCFLEYTTMFSNRIHLFFIRILCKDDLICFGQVIRA